MKTKLLIILSILTLSCSKDETNTITEKTDLKLVTGINLRQNFDDPPYQLGNPNVLVNNMFSIYPNPAHDMVSILSDGIITDVWFVRALPEKIHQEVNFSTVLSTNLYNEQAIISSSGLSINALTSNSMIVNIETLEKGYYKVFVKINGATYWDNLYKYDSQIDTMEQFNSINNFWNQ